MRCAHLPAVTFLFRALFLYVFGHYIYPQVFILFNLNSDYLLPVFFGACSVIVLEVI